MIRELQSGDFEQVFRIWQSCFGDSETYVRRFWGQREAGAEGFVYIADQQPVSMLFLLPGTLRHEELVIPSAYVYAVSTLPDYRGRGYAAALGLYAADAAREKGLAALCLLPAEASLQHYYAKLDYVLAFTNHGAGKEVEAREAAPGFGLGEPFEPRAYAALRHELWNSRGYFAWGEEMLEYLYRETLAQGGGFLEAGLGLSPDGILRQQEPTEETPYSEKIGMLAPLQPIAHEFLERTQGQAYLGLTLD